MQRTAARITVCISGDADWVLNLSATMADQQAARTAIPITQAKVTIRPSGPGKWAPTAIAMQKTNVAGISERIAAAATSPASRTQRGAGEARKRSNSPSSISRARLTPAAAPVKPAPWSIETGIMKLA